MPPANTQFSIAVHLLARLGFDSDNPMTSEALAKSINASPSFVRRILAKLSKAGLVKATAGKAGCCRLSKPVQRITLLDIYKATGPTKVFYVHQYPAIKVCPVSCHVRSSMGRVFTKAQQEFEKGLQHLSLATVIKDIKLRCK